MPMGHTDASQKAAEQLAFLAEYFVDLPLARRRPIRQIEDVAPCNVDTVSHIHASVREIADYMAVESPGTLEPLPASAPAVYDWLIRNTDTDDDAAKRRRDSLVYRQYLEHAIAAGDPTVVRRHPCPGCGCFGLHWRAPIGKAVCRNRTCRTPEGRAQVWSLAFLAHEYIESQEKRAARAT